MSQVRESLRQYLGANPGLKYLFFGGKGGVGKTAMSGAAALWLAEQGRKTLLASTNPVHSLSSLLKQDVFGRETPVAGTPLVALEVDTRDTIQQKKTEIRAMVNWFLKFSDIVGTRTEDFVESATMNPAFEESAMFENMMNLILENRYDVYVFDTAPTANARRLLGMSQVFGLWVDKMLQTRREAAAMHLALSFTKKSQPEPDPLMDYLTRLRDRVEKMHSILTDRALTSFFFVTLPEALPIAVIKRFIGWFKDFGIPVGGVIVNGLIEEKAMTPDAPEYVKNRFQMQERHLAEIFRDLPDVRALLPYMDHEIQGVDMLRQTARRLFA